MASKIGLPWQQGTHLTKHKLRILVLHYILLKVATFRRFCLNSMEVLEGWSQCGYFPPPVHSSNKLVKFAEDVTLMSVMVKVNPCSDTSLIESDNIKQWAIINHMFLNFAKTWEMVVHGNVTISHPEPVHTITHKSWLKLLGIIFQENSTNWDIQFKELIRKSSRRMYILRVCKFYGFSEK